MSYTAKTVILEMADSRSGTHITGVRSVDFWYSGSKLTVLAADITCYATDNYASFPPSAAFDTSLSKTGAGDNNACLNASYPSRIICVFDSAITFDEIRINNYHSSGGTTYYGVQNTEIIISSDTITDTVYGNSVSNSTIIFDDVFDEHAYTDTEDEQILTLGIPIRTVSFTGVGGAIAGGQSTIESESVPLPYTPKPDYTARSVVIDIDNTWGGTYSGIRSIDFWLDNEKLTNSPSISTIYATGYISNYLPSYAFDTSLSKTGDAENTSLQYAGVLGRIICVFNTLTVFDEIKINNYHDWGGNTNRGIKDVVITISPDIITDTTHNATISNPSVIFDGSFDEHAADDGDFDGDIEDEQNLTLIELPPIFIGLGGAIAGGSSSVAFKKVSISVVGVGGALAGGTALISSQISVVGNYTQAAPVIYGKCVNGYVINGNYKVRAPSISGKALTTVLLTGDLYRPRVSIFGTDVAVLEENTIAGSITVSSPTINSQATNTIMGNGNVVAKAPSISSQMSSESFATGNIITKVPTISSRMFNTNDLIGNIKIKHGIIDGIAINSNVINGNYKAPLARINAICDNPKTFNIIRYNRDQCSYI